MTIQQIKEAANTLLPQMIEIRRHLHTEPELSFEEHKTAAFIQCKLDDLKIPWSALCDTGVVGLIKGDLPGESAVALRADIDALPITELCEHSYTSSHHGIMHACGHDAHTASLLGTAAILKRMTSQFAGSIKLIFQPAEEKLPGGAQAMINAGVLKNPTPQIIIGQHCDPSIRTGEIGICAGRHMASMDELTITVTGTGGHAALPHKNVDPVMIAAQILVSLQQLVSRMANPTTPTVLSIGKIVADGAINIIPDKVLMQGTFRTFDESWRKEAHIKMRQLASSIATGLGGSCKLDINYGYPVLENNVKHSESLRITAKEYLGKDKVIDSQPWTAAEDFAYYSQAMPACFYLLGVGNPEKGIAEPLHSPRFNIDEEALAVGAGLMAYIAIAQLQQLT
jgi:amidohydrolase